MDNAAPKITELIDSPDMVEIIRDQVAALLSLELNNQYKLAQKAAVTGAKDFNIPVYSENGYPYEASGDTVPMRFINVLLPKVISLTGNSRLGNQKEQATIWVDCIACGNDFGTFRDDKSASLRAWKIVRLVRRILMSDAYTYLGLQGIVGSRFISSFESGSPDKPEREKEAALSFVVIRLSLEVQFMECSIRTNGVPMEAINFEVEPVTGEVTAI